MGLNDVYIGLGSNLNNPIKQINLAVESLKALSHDNQIQLSSLYQSKPMAGLDQPDYYNAVVLLSTNLEALDLLDKLQDIENSQGRIRDKKWDARTLDLDLLLFNNEIINHPRLTVPHYGLKERNFVLYPLYDISPDLILPDGTILKELYKNCSKNGINEIDYN